MRNDGRYDLQYWVGNKFIETIEYDKPKPILKSIEKKRRASGSYSLGHFKYKLN